MRLDAARLLVLVVGSALCSEAAADSALRLSPPTKFGTTRAVVYNSDGQVAGTMIVELREDASGRVVLASETHLEDGSASSLRAILEPGDDGRWLRPLRQESRSHGAGGRDLIHLRIDHERKRGECASEGMTQGVELPDDDRIANVPVNLLFEPLARREREVVNFQFLLCRGRPRLLDARATVVEWRTPPEGGDPIAEIEYTVRLGPILSRLARPFMPRIVFWLDPAAAQPWIGHRKPIRPNGRSVTVLRTDVAPGVIEATGALPSSGHPPLSSIP